MSASPEGVGPDLVIAGAARSGTTLLSAQLALHPGIDAGAVKEPNFFSREFDRGSEWYDSYFAPRSASLLRMDASVSYTYPQYPQALPRLAEAAPHARVVYVVRDPVDRAVSHYLLYRYYFGHEHAPDFGAALRSRDFYLDVGDYAHWLDALHGSFRPEQVTLVPFRALTASAEAVADVVLGQLGLTPQPSEDDARVQAHKNNVVTFRSETARRVTRAVRHSPAYPIVRRVLGPHLVKRVRAALTRVPDLPTVEQAMASCDDSQRAVLAGLRARAAEAVAQELDRQDAAIGVDWSQYWVAPDSTSR